MTSQDFVKRIDLTGLLSVTGSEMNQLLETAKLADDKGMRLLTQDTAANTPLVPVPGPALPELESVTTEFWKRYEWVRLPFATGSIRVYNWNETLASHAVLLKWEETANAQIISSAIAFVEAIAQEALDKANTALTAATTALNTADIAQDTAEAADTKATEAISKANEALTVGNKAQAEVDALEAVVADLDETTDITNGTGIVPIDHGGSGATNVVAALHQFYLEHVFLGAWIFQSQYTGAVIPAPFVQDIWTPRIFNTLPVAMIGVPPFGVDAAAVSIDGTTTIIRLSAGNWLIEADCNAMQCAFHQTRLVNSDTSAVLALGSSAFADTGSSMSNVSSLRALIRVADGTHIKIEHRCTATGLFGVAAPFGNANIYAQLKLVKLGLE